MSGAASEPDLTILTASHELSLCLSLSALAHMSKQTLQIFDCYPFSLVFFYFSWLGESQTVSGKSAASKFGYGE